MMKNILVVGDRSARADAVVRNLRDYGYDVKIASVEESQSVLLGDEKFDLVIVSRAVADDTVFSVAKTVKEKGIRLFVTSEGATRPSYRSDSRQSVTVAWHEDFLDFLAPT